MIHGLLLAAVPAASAAPETFRFDLGATLSHFQQQVKTEVGGARGERLVEETQVGLATFATRRIWGPLAVGLFTQLDFGSRSAARFAGFDASGGATTEGEVGGSYVELWIGPLVRAGWRGAFLEAGWGALGLRDDDARDDLANDAGGTGGLLRTSPSIAWLFAAGGRVSFVRSPAIDLVLRLEYRIRYYVTRGGRPLADDIVHGTQNMTPFVGVAWRPGTEPAVRRVETH